MRRFYATIASAVSRNVHDGLKVGIVAGSVTGGERGDLIINDDIVGFALKAVGERCGHPGTTEVGEFGPRLHWIPDSR